MKGLRSPSIHIFFFSPKDIIVTSLFNFLKKDKIILHLKIKNLCSKWKISIYIVAKKNEWMILSPIFLSMENISHEKDNLISNSILN